MDLLEVYANFSRKLLDRTTGAQIEPLMHDTLLDLRKVIAFDGAWWGWKQCSRHSPPRLLNSSVFDMPSRFRDKWLRICANDPLCHALRNTPDQPAVYDRLNDDRSQPMYRLTNEFGVRHIIGAFGQAEAAKPVMFLYLYRKDPNSAPWSEEEQKLFAKVVQLIKIALQHCDMSCNSGKVWDAFYIDVTPGGAVLTHAPRSPEALRSFFPDWTDLRYVPRKYLSQFLTSGQHHIPELGLVTTVEHRKQRRQFELYCVEVRREHAYDLLAPKEMEVARLLAEGQTIKKIALTLEKSPNTVRNQVSTIYEKLGVGNRAQFGNRFVGGPEPLSVSK